MKTKAALFVVGSLLVVGFNGVCQPMITNQPSWQTNAVGTTAMFSVGATGVPPLTFQWRFNGVDRPGATDATLVITNVQTTNQGNYNVVVTEFGGLSATSAVARLYVIVPPSITAQPTNFLTLSLGASVSNRVTATGTAPLFYQWRLNGTDQPGQTNPLIVLTNLQLAHVGDYTVIVTNAAGAVTSQVARLAVDLTFTKISTGTIVTDHATSFGCSWGDFDNDGFLDLLVPNSTSPSRSGRNFLYRNNGDGTFMAITSSIIVTEPGDHSVGVWGDFDNDGFLDLFVSSLGQSNSLFRNLGNGTFAKPNAGSLVTEMANFDGCAWGDYDNDGFIDLFVSQASGTQGDRIKNFLYRNNGNGAFTKVTNNVIATDLGNARGCAWGDYDNDGLLDLFVPQAYFATKNFLYHNDGDGRFTRVTSAEIVADLADSRGCAWGDYDNDGHLDLFVANGGRTSTQNNFLYHHNGDGTFTKIISGSIANDGGHSFGCTWGDYDNDGFLDLFVANYSNENNFLYRNNGDGTFTRITTGSPVNDGGESTGCAWGDYDNDGFLDLFVANGSDNDGTQRNFLYRNNTNSNSWVSIKLVGAVSNRSGIGAKVRVNAMVGGTNRWQLRQISGGDGYGGQNGLRAHFGLGDATNIDIVRIEWPSGSVQELRDVAVKQFRTVTEPPRLSSARLTNGMFAFTLKGGRGFQYGIHRSTNALDWIPAGSVIVTNSNSTADFAESLDLNGSPRFYRAVSP